MSDLYVKQQHKKFYLAKEYPTLKLDEIELLHVLISDADIEEHKKNSGN